MSAHPLRTITSLKAIPSYKPLPRRNVEQVSAPWLQPQITTSTTTTPSDTATTASTATTTTTTTTTTTQPTTSTTPTITLQSTSKLTYINDIDDTIDTDEFCDPFANNTNGNNSLALLDDEYDELDEEDELAQALRQIQQERQREEQTKLKQENQQVQLKHEIDTKLISNPLLAAKMTQLVREEQILKGELDVDHVNDDLSNNFSNVPNQTKRKKWTSDSVFANTALSLGDDNDVMKRQRINNDTVNSDQHKEFMRQIFK